jgi:hypothetical protein
MGSIIHTKVSALFVTSSNTWRILSFYYVMGFHFLGTPEMIYLQFHRTKWYKYFRISHNYLIAILFNTVQFFVCYFSSRWYRPMWVSFRVSFCINSCSSQKSFISCLPNPLWLNHINHSKYKLNMCVFSLNVSVSIFTDIQLRKSLFSRIRIEFNRLDRACKNITYIPTAGSNLRNN